MKCGVETGRKRIKYGSFDRSSMEERYKYGIRINLKKNQMKKSGGILYGIKIDKCIMDVRELFLMKAKLCFYILDSSNMEIIIFETSYEINR